MATLECPIEGYEDFTIDVPDTFLMRHHEAWSRGARKAQSVFGDTVSSGSEWFFGSLELCKLKNAPKEPPEDWRIELFSWIVTEVYHNRFKVALLPKKKT